MSLRLCTLRETCRHDTHPPNKRQESWHFDLGGLYNGALAKRRKVASDAEIGVVISDQPAARLQCVRNCCHERIERAPPSRRTRSETISALHNTANSFAAGMDCSRPAFEAFRSLLYFTSCCLVPWMDAQRQPLSGRQMGGCTFIW